MDASVAAGFGESQREDNAPDSTGRGDLHVPRDIVQDVAASLRSLAKVLPYSEYASIVHRIAHLRWRCGVGVPGDATRARPAAEDTQPVDT